MDKLKSVQDKLCAGLSGDPDYILDQCGDILSVNEFREIQKQSSALDKMRVLLNIIIQKGEETCLRFIHILGQHKAHYHQLQRLFNPNTAGPPAPTLFADDCSVVTARQLTNIKGKSVNMKIETVSDAGRRPSGNAGQAPPADYTAHGGSVICADNISDVSADGDINFTVSVKTSHVCTGTVGETLPSSQGPAVKMIIEHKVELIDCLRADHSFILQRVHAKHVVTDRQYQNMMHISRPEETVTNLIDQVIGKGQESCSLFLEVLKEPDILETYPQLKQIVLSNSGSNV